MPTKPKPARQKADALLAKREAENERLKALRQELQAERDDLDRRIAAINQALSPGPSPVEVALAHQDLQGLKKIMSRCADCKAYTTPINDECPRCGASPFEQARPEAPTM